MFQITYGLADGGNDLGGGCRGRGRVCDGANDGLSGGGGLRNARCSGGGRRAGGGRGRGSNSSAAKTPASERVVAGELVQQTRHLLVDGACDGAAGARVVDTTLKTGALVHTVVTRVAVIDNLLQGALVPAGYEVGVEGVASHITVGEDEWLLALTGGPEGAEEEGIPVDLEEEMRSVGPARGAVGASRSLNALARREDHVGFVGLETGGRVVTRGEVNIGTHGRGITIAALVRETNTCARVRGVLNTDAMKTIGIRRVQRRRGV